MIRAILLLALLTPALVFGQAARPSSGTDLGNITTNTVPSTDNAVTLGTSAKRWSNVFATTFTVSGSVLPTADATQTLGANGARFNLFVRDISDGSVVRWQILPGSYNYYRGTTANGASAINHLFSTSVAYTTAGAKLASFQNLSTEKFFVDKDGSSWRAAATLQTCAASTEGLISRDAAAGGTSGSRTRICTCTSDGGGSPAYAWQNIVTGTVGTTTTCPN
jgi:hypothetical protein